MKLAPPLFELDFTGNGSSRNSELGIFEKHKLGRYQPTCVLKIYNEDKFVARYAAANIKHLKRSTILWLTNLVEMSFPWEMS